MQISKDKIAANFSAAAHGYDQYAVMQQQAAHSIVERLAELRPQVVAGPILEVGCGTGAVSKELVAMFPQRQLTLVDFAPGMIDRNRQTLAPLLAQGCQIDWQVRDAEAIDVRCHYSLIASCLTIQWFQDLAASLSRLIAALRPGGILLCSYLGHGSFPEWRQACMDLGLPCTMNPLPDSSAIREMVRALGYEVSTWDEMLPLPYPTLQAFFRSLKKTGTNTRTVKAGLSRSQMARLLSTWPGQTDEPLTITYQINTILVRA